MLVYNFIYLTIISEDKIQENKSKTKVKILSSE